MAKAKVHSKATPKSKTPTKATLNAKAKKVPAVKTAAAAKPAEVKAATKPAMPAPEALMVAPAPAPTAAVKKSARAMAKIDEQTQKLGAKWQSLYNKNKTMKAEAYSMKNKYERQTPIEHKALGWGYILENKNDRLEVLFKDGIRVLISNYK